jgi:hypothetical protein
MQSVRMKMFVAAAGTVGWTVCTLAVERLAL